MAADPGIPKPGSKLGPCKKACSHRDCDESRFIATFCMCRFCGKPIGYETRFYRDPQADAPATPSDRRWVHADCFEDASDRELASACAAVLDPMPVDDETAGANFRRIRDLAAQRNG